MRLDRGKPTRTPQGFKIEKSPEAIEHDQKKTKAKGMNQNDRIEAKLDLIMEHLKIKL